MAEWTIGRRLTAQLFTGLVVAGLIAGWIVSLVRDGAAQAAAVSDVSFPSQLALGDVETGQAEIQGTLASLLHGNALSPQTRRDLLAALDAAFERVDSGMTRFSAMPRSGTVEEH